jgi:eukaryotic-like serine/threonine-protein kinase
MSDPRGDDPTVADGMVTEATVDLELRGRIAGRYDIVALIGTGGMGNVYQAIDRELGEPIALKVLRRSSGPGATTALERFRDEVKLARRVTHVNVARTHDLGRHGDTLFLTMELVEGEPLASRIARGPVPWRDAVRLARAISAGIGAAHAAGVVHRDLKPDNVLLARDGRVVVTDFGIAATYELTTDGTDRIEVTGTPAWMAPEQLAGRADARADVYAVGEILWAMLTGAHPWMIDGRLEVMQRLGADPPRLPRGAAPDAIAAVVERCLRRDPAARYRDGGDLADALADATASSDTGAGTPREPIAPAARRDVLVGVEPIRNLGVADDEFVAAGLGEDLIDVLGRIGGIRVRALGGSGARDDLDVVVGGSLRRAGDAVRISVRAAGARDGFQIWSQRFDRRLDEILRVSDEVARDVAAALSASTGWAGAGRAVATDQVVVELYLKARHLVETGWLDDPRPLTLYQAALERDPDSPVVLAACATLLGRRLSASQGEITAASAEAEQLARRAIAVGGSLPEPWGAMAAVRLNQGRNVGAMCAARLAVERGPAAAEAADIAGRILLEVDPGLDEAIALLTRARWANPRLPQNLVDLVRAHGLRGDWDHVDALLASPGTESLAAKVLAAARMALWRGQPIAELPTAMPGVIRFVWARDLIVDALARGAFDDDAAAMWQQRVEAMPRGARGRRFFAQLGVEVGLRGGHVGHAWAMLDEAVAQGLIDLAWLDHLPLLAPLRGDPRFTALRAVVAARAAPVLAAWRGPLPPADVDRWPAD